MNRTSTFTVASILAGALTLASGGQAFGATAGVHPSVRWQVVAGTFVREHAADRLITRLDSMGVKGFVMERDSRAGTIRFEVERPFNLTEAAHREEATLRSDAVKPKLEREAAEDAGR
jgi:hypothetical protein